jgi:RNA polymerase sigma-70 factor (family 1)
VEHNFLWDEIKKGNKAALKKLHNLYFHQMYLYASRAVNNGLAEELVSDCFIKLWENRHQIEIHSSLKHYLFVILHNSIIDHIRKKKLLTESLSGEYPVPDNEKEFDEMKQYAHLYRSLQKLPQQCRRILELAVFESLSYNEIAENLHISRNTVKTQMGRAYQTLRQILDPKDFNLFLFIKKRD